MSDAKIKFTYNKRPYYAVKVRNCSGEYMYDVFRATGKQFVDIFLFTVRGCQIDLEKSEVVKILKNEIDFRG